MENKRPGGKFRNWAKPFILVGMMTLTIAAMSAESAAKSYKYQLLSVPGSMAAQSFLMGMKVDDEETEFTATLYAMGQLTTSSGTIRNGVYDVTSGNPTSKILIPNSAKFLTKQWLPVTVEPGKPGKVTFNSNYDKQADVVTDFSSGDLIVGRTLSRFGYSFTGYYYDKAGTQPVAGDAVAKGGDVTVYAGWQKWDDQTTKYMEMYRSLMAKADYVMERGAAYEPVSFTKFYELAFMAFLRVSGGGEMLNKDNISMVTSAQEALKKVVQVKDPEKVSWYIWGDKMATEDGADKFEFFRNLDNAQWRPFLVPYMLKDQSKVKANIIVVAGGGYFLRSNIEEAYSTVKVMNKLGYNCFVLQRRVMPYAMLDSALDLQRAVRYLKFNAKKLGIAKVDKMVSAGFSGGGGTITNAAKYFYGDVLPSSFYSSYTDDEIDKINSDVQAMLVIYSAGDLKDLKNPNYPATFIAFGTLDPLGEHTPEYYAALKEKGIFTEIHGFAGAPHGYGAGTGIPDYTGTHPIGFGASTNQNKSDYQGASKPYLLAYTGAQQWTKLADTFLDQVFKYKPVSY